MAGQKTNYEEARRLYEAGLSLADVAGYFGVTRQSVWEGLSSRGVKMRPQKRTKSDNHFFRGTRASDRAQNTLEKAIAKGLIQRKFLCDVCRKPKTFKDGRTGIQAHHDDYNKPLDVRWLCQACHHEWHKHNKAKGREV